MNSAWLFLIIPISFALGYLTSVTIFIIFILGQINRDIDRSDRWR